MDIIVLANSFIKIYNRVKNLWRKEKLKNKKMKNSGKERYFLHFLFLICLSPFLFTLFVLGFSVIILLYSLLFCFFVFSICIGIMAILYGFHFVISIFSHFTFALFELGISLFCFGFASILLKQLNALIDFSNKLVRVVYKKCKHFIRGEKYAQ